MKIALTGVLDDGRELAVGVPTNPRRTLRIPVGETVEITCSVVRRGDGSTVTLPVNSLTFTLKKSARDSQYVVKTSGPATEGQVAVFTIPPSATKNAEPGRYVWDLWLTLDGARSSVIGLSPVDIEFSATPPP